MNFLQKVAIKILGPSWKTTLAGYGQLFGVTVYQGYQLLNGKELNQHDVIALIVSGGVAVALRFAKDEGVHVPDSVPEKIQDKVTDVIDSKLTDIESRSVKKNKPSVTTQVNPPKTVTPVVQTTAETVAAPNSVVVGEATMFGLNWDGSVDQGDNGVGAWGAKTANKEIVGVSLPEGVMISTFGFYGTWKQTSEFVGKFLGDNKIQVNVTKDGQSVLADVVDAGPTRGTHNAIDLTYALAHKLNTNGKAIVSYSIIKDGVAMEIRGWDFKNGVEITHPGVA